MDASLAHVDGDYLQSQWEQKSTGGLIPVFPTFDWETNTLDRQEKINVQVFGKLQNYS